ncbi:MAG: NAD-dependent epimerase/dehydratase family protein [Bacteroidales bacterium]|jgi:UDP-glucose 4-epimerase|nr:NAD-dependent epimerase/dehydratase family protein [Bacteroidales bacterium]
MAKILITGANGFIGKSLLDYLIVNTDIQKKEILLLSSKKHEHFETLIYDRESYSIPSIPNNIEGMIHLGAFTPKSSASSNDLYLNLGNIIYTANLLKSVLSRIDRFIFISTLDVYNSNKYIIAEKSPTDPISLYGWSKLYCEQMIIKWCTKQQVPYQILRLGHIYGAGEEAYQKIIPITIKKVLTNQSPVIFSKGEEKRSFLNVKDCARMIWQSYNYPVTESVVNIASNQSYSILEIVNTIIQISGKDLKPEILNQPIAVRDYLFDNTLMRTLFGEEQIKLLDGLREEYKYFANLSDE